MSDQMTPPAPPPAAPAATSPQMPSFLASLGRAELFMAAGAALVVLVDVVFVVFGPYGFSSIAWAAAVLTLILIFLSARMLSFSASTHRSLLLMLGLLVVATGIRDVLDDVQLLSSSNIPAAWFLGALGYYAGVAMMLFGAWQLWGRRA